MTVTAAGLAPSAMLVLEKDGATLADEELPDLPRAEILGDVGSDGDDEVVVAVRGATACGKPLHRELLDETILPKLKTYFDWKESDFYTVRISQTNQEQRPGARLIFTFEADGIRGPSSGVATFLEYFRF